MVPERSRTQCWCEAGGDILVEEPLRVWLAFISFPIHNRTVPLHGSKKRLRETTYLGLCSQGPAGWGRARANGAGRGRTPGWAPQRTATHGAPPPAGPFSG